MNTSAKIMLALNLLATIVLGSIILGDRFNPPGPVKALEVQQLRIIEPDGTLRLIISNHALLPGIIVRGKEEHFTREQAGMLFYNDEGSENGGLIFGGKKNAKGEIVNSGGSLTFDKYDANQEVQLMGVNDSEFNYAGLLVNDSKVHGKTNNRLRIGRKSNGAACLELKDSLGNKRLEMVVMPNGSASINFYNRAGQITRSLNGMNQH